MPIALQPSLEQFVQQFGLCGGCLIQIEMPMSDCPGQLYWLGYEGTTYWPCCDVAFQRYLEGAIAQPPLASAQPFEIVNLRQPQELITQWHDHLYGCLWRSETKHYYLVCWHSVDLSEHQQYGMSLYAQALAPRFERVSEAYEQQLHKVLQRSRHQLRTPLALMLLYIDLLQTIANDSRSQEWVRNLRSTVEEMNNSVNHLTELVHSIEQLDYVDLRQSIMQCVESMQPWIEQKQITVGYGAQSLWLQVDEWKICQVFQNLLNNAIAFAPMGGRITWEWQNFQTEVLIKISDNGPGLSSEDLRSIGTPYYSRRPGGTGLGLSIARQIILEHRGSLWGNNLPDGGAQFCITLPKSS
ncbi:MAG: HAMP domain-containing sensor histidine kinase [Leptolyngbyaceae cyanobacterium bins.349]|nr:HAMP domain-containing sensor histidine kinase [Leptolyngbyaceae cyanobacterium bins.349]